MCYNVMGVKGGTKWKKIHENVRVFVLHVNFKHKAQKHACVNFSFSAYFHPPLHHNGKGSIGCVLCELSCQSKAMCYLSV